MLMAGDILVDTSVAIDYLKGDLAAARVLENSSGLFAPSIVLGELLHGAKRSDRPTEHTARVEVFASKVAVLPVDLETAYHYSDIKNSLLRKGRPIPDNDMWIAAVARQHQLTVVTRDSHFGEISGIGLLSW
jgi:tRNA(fMet)-specific endonuclease VapC